MSANSTLPGDSGVDEAFRPILGSRAFEEVVDQLTHSIHLGTFGVGDHLPTVKELAETFRVSHSTVLEAVRILQRAGVLGVKRGATGGMVVLSNVIPTSVFKLSSSRIARDVLELLEARRPIELELARLAVVRGRQDEIAEVRAALEMQEQSVPESDEWVYANYKFHYAIGKAAHSNVLAHFQSELTKEMAMFVEEHRSLNDSDNPAGVLEEHRTILRGLEAKDPEVVRNAVSRHLTHLEQQAEELGLSASDSETPEATSSPRQA